MPTHSNDRLQGALDLLILKVLARGGSLHGYAIAQRSDDVDPDRRRVPAVLAAGASRRTTQPAGGVKDPS